MAGIEDFVLDAVLTDLQQQFSAPPDMMSQQMQPQPGAGVPMAPPTSVRGQANALVAANPNSAVNPETGLPWGQYADQYENKRVAALQTKDKAQVDMLRGIQGLDPQIQGTILKRMGIDPGPIMGKLQQQMMLEQHKARLEQPQQDIQNALKRLGLEIGQRQGTQELELKKSQFEQEQAGRADTRNLQLMKLLATMIQADTTGKLAQQVGPALMQMLGQAGINLAPQAGASAGGRVATAPKGPRKVGNATITQED